MNKDKNKLEPIDISFNNETPTVSGRELHEALEIKTPYKDWFPRMCEYGFTEGMDYWTERKNVLRADGSVMPQTQHDHNLTIHMAKELCMLARNEKGREFRRYFIMVEEAWNSPEMVMTRALKLANRNVDRLTEQVNALKSEAAENEPRIRFAKAVETSRTSILVGELAKILKQNGLDIGQNRLFERLRAEGYLMKGGSSHNLPTQRAMELGLFEVKESTVTAPDGSVRITRTTKVTGKGQEYFITKYLFS